MSKKRVLICLFVLTAGLLFAQNDSETQNRFSLGAGFSALGPEIDFSYYNNHFTAEAQVSVPAVMHKINYMLGIFDILPKIDVGYVTSNKDGKCRFAFGGSYISTYSFEDPMSLQILSLFGKVFKNFFNNKLELSFKAYLPFCLASIEDGRFEFNATDIMTLVLVGGMSSTISVKYCF